MTDYPQPPASAEAERALIGAILNGADMDEVSAVLEPSDFYLQANQRIYQQCLNMHNAGHTLDVVTVSEWMDDAGELKKVGGLSRLGEMAQDTPVVAQAPAYAKIVREHALRRSLILLANRAQQIAYNPDGRSAAEMVGEVEEALSALQIARGSSEAQLIRDLIPAAMEEVERRYEARNREELVGLSTGYVDLDNMLGGLEGGDLIVVAGRPSMGKSAFSANIAMNVGSQGKASVIFDLEMSTQERMFRLMSCTSFVPMQHIRTGYMDDKDWPKLSQAIPKIKNLPIRIDANANITWPEIRSQCRRWARKGELDLVVIDYLQLLAGEGDRDHRADEKIAAITRGCKLMAKELGIPVILLSQLNRSLESRPNKRPMMSDLRQSGAIEQDADLVLFTYRDELYDEDSDDKGITEIIIGKQRNGPVGKVKLAFLAQFTRHENLAKTGENQ